MSVNSSLKNVIVLIKKNGLKKTLLILLRIMFKLPPSGEINHAKKKVFRIIENNFGKLIGFGPFKGMIYEQSWWGGYDRISKVLGVYELDVLNKLVGLFKDYPNSTFIDIGAADGYYSIGFLFSGLTKNVYAYEIEEMGRRAIFKNAKENNCQGFIKICSEANIAAIRDSLNSCANHAIVLIDIEGAEYNLLCDDFLDLLKSCHVLIELHPFFIKDGIKKENDLIEKCEKLFHIEKIYRDSYNPNHFECLNKLTDDERLLALSEGRAYNPKWLLLSPIT